MKKLYLILFLLSSWITSDAQETTLSENAEISILTIGPGSLLNDSFGHSAFRVKDVDNNIDVVYNYGTYDFNTPNFYLKFARGKLLYKIDYNNFTPFYNYYVRQNRWIKEQVLNISVSEKQKMFNFLLNNVKPENRDYMYDFLFDNCATRIRDVLVTVLDGKLTYKDDYTTEKYTFRQLIQKNVYWNSWGSFGMDIAIGAVVDQKATVWQYQFLPYYVMEAASNAKITNASTPKNLVKTNTHVFKATPKRLNPTFYTSPLFMMGLLGLLIIYITYKDYKRGVRSRYLDTTIFFVTGLIGLMLLLLWVATDHSTTANNYNLLWASPLSLFFIIAISKKNPKKWIRKYIFLQVLLLILLCMHWITGVQIFAYGLIPLLIALFVRSIFLLKFLKK